MKTNSFKFLFLIAFLMTLLVGCDKKPKTATEKPSFLKDSITGEQYRPNFHFTPKTGWMNDPNGMVFYEGEYHLFYQFYPDDNVWGPMHWGHAVSKDIIRWEHLPIALYPDELGYIFSGSAVIDWENTSGFGTKKNSPMVAIFTYHSMEGEKAGTIDFQTQGIAYSIDKGRTWIKYQNNPVITNPGIKDFRDPKVFWYAKENKWIMSLAVKNHIAFYSSKDLKSWKLEGQFGADNGSHDGVWECPDLFPLIDQNGVEKWVLLVSINPGGPQGGSATQYFIGDFDGNTFTTSEKEIKWLDYGADNYAGITFSDIPENDGRRLFMGWLSNWQYAREVPTYSWRSAMTIPRELTLQETENGYIVNSIPVEELQSILSKGIIEKNNEFEVLAATYLLEIDKITSEAFSINLANRLNEVLKISVIEDKLFVDRKLAGIGSFNDVFPAIHEVPLNGIRIHKIEVFVDKASIEIFINNGERVITELVFPNEPYKSISISGDAELVTIYPIDSISEN
ncbi:glycoside hydrolase family 32 protein [Lutibacter flavus]|uniref:Fructan beta-fructosidase n=1 Tax=Lutibacter flavus TaxID=691689 RepID=A0A238VVA9_9FLAO|nr:glycoside hydrolase family 32 protein [Lutibacter flavus]SNR38255.1 fructan beta-fructosidase [Lutibacter flavus]